MQEQKELRRYTNLLSCHPLSEGDRNVKTRAVCLVMDESVPVLDRTYIAVTKEPVVGHVVDRELCIIYSYRHRMEERGVNLADCTSIMSWSDFAFGIISPLTSGNYSW